jgi:hypothetical protein
MVEMRKRTLLIALAVIAIGLIGTGLSTLYRQNIITDFTGKQGVYKVSYGFPLGSYGHSHILGGIPIFPSSETYWFSLGSLLLDAAFWIAISFFVSVATIKSVNILQKARASKNLSVINI